MELNVQEGPTSITNGVETSAISTVKSGKKKAKRKNKSKNIGTNPIQEQLQQQEEKLSEVKNSASGKLNGLHGDIVDKVSEKLEQELKLKSQNGLINGSVSGSEEHPIVAKTKSATAKKKHRSRQKTKTQEPITTNERTIEINKQTIDNAVSSISPKTSNETAIPAIKEMPIVEELPKPQILYQAYESELQMPSIMSLIQKDLSEPYSIYTYRYFIHNWPRLCFLALHEDRCVGAIVCKLDIHRHNTRRGYIAMLAVDKDYRKLKIGTTLVQKAIQAMLEDNADEVVLETEITNQPALRLYENLGFVRDKRLFHYYLNGVDALRLKLWFR
ncbi:N-alpha-acetyltransferase 30A-like [Topomyia yanbarensis]|uniref:N-alpha-acetyltransferase 30A-like n=1 Tax=Topomyia yanbarensis TaxID=2498891 RepID=UPI00273A904B|nr:N-alpha-acetyltransferase 30A-like [Topomyia yanbarensis]